ncbi:MAG TPA: type VI secretion system tube protein Hcp [Geminicoccaceae bacterium]|nr:type VI secretion system tube protein Hcp [Geminicoccaceae bacterium]
MAKHAGPALAALALLGSTVFGAPAEADDIFVVFENPAAGALPVKGAASDEEMAKLGALEVDSIEFGIENSLVIDPQEGATGPGRPDLLPLKLELPLGPGVPALLQTAGTGGHYGGATVHFRTNGRKAVDYATLALKLVAVTSVEVSAHPDEPPQAEIALTYGAMQLDVYAHDATGALAKTPETGRWNFMSGTADFSAVPKR